MQIGKGKQGVKIARMVLLIACVATICLVLAAQEKKAEKLQISSAKISMLPGAPPLAAPTCKESQGGYLEIDGRTDLTEAEIGRHVMAEIKKGYILTIYPMTRSGIFENAECASGGVTASKTP